MSNEVMIPDVANVPAHLQQSGPVESGLVTGNESLPRISLKGRQFRFIVDREEKVAPAGQPLNVIIIGASPKTGCAKVFYKGAYESGSADAPDCASSDGIYPDTDNAVPQSDMCQTCPQNAWGSGKKADGTLSEGKACRDTKILYVTAPGKIKGMLFQLRVPVMSLKSLNALGHALEKRRLTSHSIVSRLEFTDSEFPQITFNFDTFLGPEVYADADERANSEELRRLIVTGISEQLAAKAEDETAAAATETAAAATETAAAATETVEDPGPSQAETTQTAAAAVDEVDLENLWGDDPPAGDASPAKPGPPGIDPPAGSPPPPGIDPNLKFGLHPDGVWRDATGAVWDPINSHAKGADGKPAYVKSGNFKAKRKTAAAATEPPSPAEGLPAGSIVTGGQAAAPAAGAGTVEETETDLMDGWV